MSVPSDLRQDIWYTLLSKDEYIIQRLDERGELLYYVVGIVKNQLYSKNSAYYKQYVRPQMSSVSIDDIDDVSA